LAALLKELGIDRNSPEQKAWEAYRDAQLRAIYPATDNDIAEYGSAYPMCLATLKKRLTEGRISGFERANDLRRGCVPRLSCTRRSKLTP
jgi:Lysozyme inhibitor LprI